MFQSPYYNQDVSIWKTITEDLVASHPLSTQDLKKCVLEAWNEIFQSSIGNYKIGLDIQPKPQIMGFLLHELIPLKLAQKYPSQWRIDKEKKDKDIVYMLDEKFSIEIKTSSNSSKVFANRSYAQTSKTGKRTKDKSGYYLLVNYQKFSDSLTTPQILKIRFGWLDEQDWKGQESQTGQQANLSPDIYEHKFISIL
ncbi:MAG: ScaI family restriction endonuclease [Akkermansia sp.]